MARTKQTKRSNVPGALGLSPKLATGPQVPPAKATPAKNATKKTSATGSSASKPKTCQGKNNQPKLK